MKVNLLTWAKVSSLLNHVFRILNPSHFPTQGNSKAFIIFQPRTRKILKTSTMFIFSCLFICLFNEISNRRDEKCDQKKIKLTSIFFFSSFVYGFFDFEKKKKKKNLFISKHFFFNVLPAFAQGLKSFFVCEFSCREQFASLLNCECFVFFGLKERFFFTIGFVGFGF